MKMMLALSVFVLCFAVPVLSQEQFEKDIIKTAAGDVEITFIGHGSLMLKFGGKVMQVDPYSKVADYAKLPKADAVLITHEHYDHLDPDALKAIRTNDTVVVISPLCADKVSGGSVMKNGDVKTVMGISVEAVPAYNLVHKRDNGKPFHARGDGNGYVLTIGGTRMYIAGDTENTAEMKALKNIDIAFLPMNLPYTMTPDMVADAAKAFKPKVLYPYHFGETDVSKLVALMKDTPEVEVRVRKMK